MSSAAARRFSDLPPKARMRVVSLLLSSAALGFDLRELIAIRRELVSLGILLNQSLQASWGQVPDADVHRAISKKLWEVLR